ncbi:hypothetical protein RD792_012950 [Penstemon davidsonii]|uniref:Probable purine permease n=1 Tax=Penstemon davidsonii TaxID=160366 RepID=A0ABR0CYA4_9LAMI|nr:hypothetical protein RD792_012948 [Penstemon davidsonii]KAK4482028.1 hypothetical protein RD792_012950 [Penstemon davidsonii]
MLGIGNCGGPLMMRLYFIRGGKRIWLSCFLQTAGWPIILIPLLVTYTRRHHTTPFFMKPRVLAAASVIGVLIGLDNYLYATGVAKLPVSTSALIVATQLAFTSTFAFLIVKQKFTAYSVNAVVLLTVGAVVLGIHSSGDRPRGESKGEYLLGFFMTLGAAALYGFIQPLVELTYLKAKQTVNYSLVLQMQMVICFFATGFCTVAMLINKDFQAIPREAKAYELGERKYYVVLCLSPIIWQCFFLGVIGVIFYASALLSGIMITVTLPLTEILGVIFYHENFQAEKGISLFLSLWGFLSYFYGQKINHNNKNNSSKCDDPTAENELTRQVTDP